MGIFQRSVLDKYLKEIDKSVIKSAYEKFKTVFCNSETIKNIETSKEEQWQEGFLRELFVNCLGYTNNPNPGYNLTTEYKNVSDSRKADGAIVKDENLIGVIELKGTDTFDLKTVEKQAFGYRYAHPTCKYIITSNFKELRFYIDTYESFEEFLLFNMGYDDFEKLYLCLSMDSIFSDKPLKMKTDSKLKEEDISDKLYKDYHRFKMNIYNSMAKNNPAENKVNLLKKSQKLLDRILFILFSEDRGLLPPNTISKIITENKELADIGRTEPLYNTYKIYFSHINLGNAKLGISEYNGGLFAPDALLDNLIIDDDVLKNDVLKLSAYNFSTDIDVNILGHIFENSLNDIDELHAEVTGTAFDKSKTKRKKDGVFYTPKYITKYIVDNTLGALCEEKKKELNLVNIVIGSDTLIKDAKIKGKYKYKFRVNDAYYPLLAKLDEYQSYLISLKILDPACGSGAFLIQALDFLIEEHKFIDNTKFLITHSVLFRDNIDISILENNLYGVDINEESVELARLSLWLRTAVRGRKLNNLSNNIKCGNSLIDDPAVAGDLAFKWDVEFPDIMSSGGFDVVIGNPPYVFARGKIIDEQKKYYISFYKTAKYQINTFSLFMEKGIKLLKNKKFLGFIIPNSLLKMSSMSKIREFLLNSGEVKTIIQLFGYSFENVNVETIITIFQKDEINKAVSVLNLYSELDIHNQPYIINSSNWLSDPEFRFQLALNDNVKTLIDKIKKDSNKLSDLFEVKAGLQAYEAGKGNPKQTPEDVKKRPYDFNYKFDEKTYEYLDGKNVGRYFSTWDNMWLQYGEMLAASRTFDIFERPRLLIREITGSFPNTIVSSYFNRIFLNNRSIINVIETSNDIEKLKCLLLIINSTLISYYFQIITPKSDRKMFPKVILQDLREFPIKIPTAQAPFIEKADTMLTLNKTLQEKKSEFIEWLKTEFAVTEISNKLDNFYELDFDTMKTELKKKMPKGKELGPKEIGSLKKYFDDYKTELLNLKNVIDKTDKEIDRMVYELYGLTEEEIRIVEGGA